MDIAIDMEGTLAEIHTPYLKYHNIKYETNYSLQDLVWDFKGTNINDDEFTEITKKLWRINILKIPPTERSLSKYINRVNERYNLDIVTARKGCEDEMQEWLERQDIKYRNFIANENKNELDYDIFVEDDPNIDTSRLILYKRPWNKGKDCLEELKSFQDLECLLEKLNKKSIS